MNVDEFMKKHGLTEAMLDERAAPYEDGSFSSEPGAPSRGSHVDAVGTKRVTVIYPARDTQRATALARSRGVKVSEIFRDALADYLRANAA
ncbi:MAG: hypothetical protein SPI77_04145 [Corynebacterium sp.]|nr:hypothetical protein [Corynebacterium sp.]